MKTPDGTASLKQESNLDRATTVVVPEKGQLLRIERIGIRLFGVANCVVSFGQVSTKFGKNERSMAALEASFCDSLIFPHEPVMVSDARLNPATATNPWVVGPPYVRFYAAQPILNKNSVVGAIYLIDYAVRQYHEEDAFLLNDLASLAERELFCGSLQVAHNDMLRQNRSLRRESMIDPLFGTWNRSAIIRSLEIEVTRCKASVKPVSLIMVSINNYTELKNEFGLHVAESVSIKMVSRIRSCVRPFDALGRYGTEEFLVVLPGISHTVIQAVTERIRSAVLLHSESVNSKTIDITVCMGTVSTDVFTNMPPDELINQVEQALYSAKKAGNNKIVHAVFVGT